MGSSRYWSYAINTDVKKDPSWGTDVVQNPSVFVVRYWLKKQRKKEHAFFLFLPPDLEHFEQLRLMEQMSCAFFENGDEYEVREVAQEDIENFSDSFPILVYDKNAKNKFYWLTPPTMLKS